MKKIFIIIGGVIAALVLGVVIFLGYMGMFSSLDVIKKEMGPYVVAYDSYVGPYQETGQVFDRVNQQLEKEGIRAELGLGIYYDNPSEVPADKLRSDCGSVLPQDANVEELKTKFKIKTIEKQLSLVIDFPIKNALSYMLGPMKAYPALNEYAKQNNLEFKMTYEVYDMPSNMTYYVAVMK
ncbi:MAG: hypothetical protein GY854_18540 [Deltaproteobacteria bacterium]|nr:hypothetical protein [Deltaproteobacteria bacterium]